MPLVTVGHSNRSIDEFIEILRAHRVDTVADVRTVPRSRHNPQFNREALPGSLAAAGIEYVHMPGLGGLRHPRKDSVNKGWRNLSFRGYADYMQTPEFAQALDELLRLASGRRVAAMCAEAVPWRCHRSLIADAAAARGVEAEHLMSAAKSEPHRMTKFARVEGQIVTYPPEEMELF
ncbi:MAG TPA: DUF488 domain-containing protein [Bryobacteraceae bacterium]|jgi:uncharacterized protein (DUF488 family)|nr:DUF488 domain-containing protein [Bryobacteraceae bacterium]